MKNKLTLYRSKSSTHLKYLTQWTTHRFRVEHFQKINLLSLIHVNVLFNVCNVKSTAVLTVYPSNHKCSIQRHNLTTSNFSNNTIWNALENTYHPCNLHYRRNGNKRIHMITLINHSSQQSTTNLFNNHFKELLKHNLNWVFEYIESVFSAPDKGVIGLVSTRPCLFQVLTSSYNGDRPIRALKR